MFSPWSSGSLPYHPTTPEKATGVGLIGPTLIAIDEAVLPPDSHLPLLNIVA